MLSNGKHYDFIITFIILSFNPYSVEQEPNRELFCLN